MYIYDSRVFLLSRLHLSCVGSAACISICFGGETEKKVFSIFLMKCEVRLLRREMTQGLLRSGFRSRRWLQLNRLMMAQDCEAWGGSGLRGWRWPRVECRFLLQRLELAKSLELDCLWLACDGPCLRGW